MDREHTTTDLWACAYAVARGVRLVRTKPGYMLTFVLDNTEGQAVRELGRWYEGDAQVSARTFAGAYRDLRNLARSSATR